MAANGGSRKSVKFGRVNFKDRGGKIEPAEILLCVISRIRAHKRLMIVDKILRSEIAP